MISVHNIKPETHNVFIGKELIQYNDDVSILVRTKLDIDKEFEKPFEIDKKNFSLLAKFKEFNYTLKNNDFCAKFEGGGFKTRVIEPKIPILNYENRGNFVEFDLDNLKKAMNFVASPSSSFNALKGVVVDEFGNIFATDTINAYYHIESEEKGETKYSIPTFFIDKIESGDLILKKDGVNNYVCCITETKEIYARLWDGKLPDIWKVVENVERNENTFEFEIDEKVYLMETEQLKLVNDSTRKETRISLFDNETSFMVQYPSISKEDYLGIFATKRFLNSIKGLKKLKVAFTTEKDRQILINDSIILSPMREN